jgi:AcrR family transcriptional regulator
VGKSESAGAGPRRRLTRAQAKARTRGQLLDAAARVFAQKGFAGASVEEIAETAGYSFGAVYSNFDSKEQLFLELMSSRLADVARSVTEAVEDGSAGGEEPLARLSRLLVEIADKNPELTLLQAEFWLYAVRNPDAMDALAARTREQVVALERLVASAMDRLGVSPEVAPAAVTTLVLGLFQGLVRHRRIDPGAVPDELVAQGFRWLFAGIIARPVPAPRSTRRSRGEEGIDG